MSSQMYRFERITRNVHFESSSYADLIRFARTTLRPRIKYSIQYETINKYDIMYTGKIQTNHLFNLILSMIFFFFN